MANKKPAAEPKATPKAEPSPVPEPPATVASPFEEMGAEDESSGDAHDSKGKTKPPEKSRR